MADELTRGQQIYRQVVTDVAFSYVASPRPTPYTLPLDVRKAEYVNDKITIPLPYDGLEAPRYFICRLKHSGAPCESTPGSLRLAHQFLHGRRDRRWFRIRSSLLVFTSTLRPRVEVLVLPLRAQLVNDSAK